MLNFLARRPKKRVPKSQRNTQSFPGIGHFLQNWPHLPADTCQLGTSSQVPLSITPLCPCYCCHNHAYLWGSILLTSQQLITRGVRTVGSPLGTHLQCSPSQFLSSPVPVPQGQVKKSASKKLINGRTRY